MSTADELQAIYESGLETGELHNWLDAISRYCDAAED